MVDPLGLIRRGRNKRVLAILLGSLEGVDTEVTSKIALAVRLDKTGQFQVVHEDGTSGSDIRVQRSVRCLNPTGGTCQELSCNRC
jgi:hypothetical protein